MTCPQELDRKLAQLVLGTYNRHSVDPDIADAGVPKNPLITRGPSRESTQEF